MAISYPLSLPNSPDFASLKMRLQRAVAVSRSPFSYRQQVYLHQGALWEAEATLPPMERAEAAEWQAFFTSLRGQYGTFVMGDPAASTPRGTASSASVDAAGSIGDTSIAMKSMGSGNTLLKGDYFQLGSGASTRLYQVVEDATADGTGDATVTFEPPLKVAANVDDTVTLTNPKGLWRLSANDPGWDIDVGPFWKFTFACTEAF